MGKELTYYQKLKHPKWQKKRLEILTRDNFTCQECQDKDSTLHVHHKTYVYGNDPWDYHDNNFISLCENCHKEEEFYKEEFNSVISDGLMCGLSYKEMWHIMHDVVRDKIHSK